VEEYFNDFESIGMEIMKDCTHDFSSSEEWKAFGVYEAVHRYYNEKMRSASLEFPKEILSELNFEILNVCDLSGRRNFTLISMTKPIDFNLFYFHLKTFGIDKEFIDKRTSESRSFLSVWK
jgi:hypothetical protein